MTFLQKSYGDYSKVENPFLVTMSYEGLDDEEELKTVSIISNNNENNLNIDYDSDTNFEHEKKTFLMMISMTCSNPP